MRSTSTWGRWNLVLVWTFLLKFWSKFHKMCYREGFWNEIYSALEAHMYKLFSIWILVKVLGSNPACDVLIECRLWVVPHVHLLYILIIWAQEVLLICLSSAEMSVTAIQPLWLSFWSNIFLTPAQETLWKATKTYHAVLYTATSGKFNCIK